MKEYRIPHPSEGRKAHVTLLVLAYKVKKGIEYDDRDWDAIHFGRGCASAVKLLSACKDFGLAERCLNELSDDFEKNGLMWTFETVNKHCHDWLARKGKIGGDRNMARTRFFKEIAKRGSGSPSEDHGGFATGGEVLNRIRGLQVVKPSLDSERRGNREDEGNLRKVEGE